MVYFHNDVVLISQTRMQLNDKLELWREALKCEEELKVSSAKIEYMECKCNGLEQ